MKSMLPGENILIWRKLTNSKAIYNLQKIMYTIPTFYPYSYVPKSFLYIIALSPTTPAAVIAQGAFGLSAPMNSMFYIMIIETVIYTILARILVRWREN